ncbi:MAG: hypothetical protein ISR65_17700 [Bacteriovoracaceae bacterium]|nr:hypothetical protein [Bacteriovoracaceae bacterium]
MEQNQKDRIDKASGAIQGLLQGQIPSALDIEGDPDDEIKQLSGYINRLIHDFGEVNEFIAPLAAGNLNIDLPVKNFLSSPFKQLHANLKHLTWQTQQIAKGDFHQKVDFMGDFSTAFNSMTAKLEKTQKSLILERENAIQFAETKSRYLNSLIHEIRTHLTCIVGFGTIMGKLSLEEKAKNCLDRINANVDSLYLLVNNALDLAKLEKHKVVFESIEFDMRQLFLDVSNLVAVNLSSKVHLVCNTAEGIPQKVKGDPLRIKQVLLNLLDNAVKFTKEGQIEVGAQIEDQDDLSLQILIYVKDTGIGIEESKLEAIFGDFFQSKSSTTREYGGTGLGLTICKELIEQMNGTIHVTSKLQEGTKFFFRLKFPRVPYDN